MTCDPYEADEADLSKTCALESSLWEIKSLTCHWYPDVALAAENLLNKPLPVSEWNIAKCVDVTPSDVSTEPFMLFIVKVIRKLTNWGILAATLFFYYLLLVI